MNALESTSTRPYLIRALYEWAVDNTLTPYIAVLVDDSVMVPREYVKDGEIVLNISMDATSNLKLGNEYIEFKARFAGIARDIMVPINRVLAIYARENGQGMAFPVAVSDEAPSPQGQGPASVETGAMAQSEAPPMQLVSTDAPGDGGPGKPEPPRPAGGGPRPALKRIK